MRIKQKTCQNRRDFVAIMEWVLQGKTPAGGKYYHKGRQVKIEYRDYYLIYDVPENMPLYAGCGKVVFDSRVDTAPLLAL